MANRIVSIEVGYSLTKICEMDYKGKNPKIYQSFVLQTPEGMINDGIITIDDAFVETFKSALVEKKIHTKQVVFSISSSRIAIRDAKIPFCREKRIADVVRANLEEYFPIELNRYEFSHSIIGVEMAQTKVEEELEDKPKQRAAHPTGYQLLVLAVPKPLMDNYRTFAKQLGLTIVAIDYSGNSIFRAAKNECEKGTQLIIKIDEQSTMLMVLRNGFIALNRTIAYGIDDTIDVLSEITSTEDYWKTLKYARSNDSFQDEKVTDSLSPLMNGITRVIDYYNSNHTSETIEKIHVTGVGADLMGILELLSGEIGMPVEKLTHISGMHPEKHFKNDCFGEYVTCMGATMAPMDFYLSSTQGNEKSKKGTISINGNLLSKVVFFAGLFIGVAFMVASIVPYLIEKDKNENYNARIEELRPAYEIYLDYVAANTETEELKTLDSLTNNRNEEMITFFYNLEQNMPSSFCLNTLSVTPQTIVMDVTVAKKEEVASVISELRNNEMFSAVEVTSVTELETEIGETQYGFAVNLIYAKIVETEEGEE